MWKLIKALIRRIKAWYTLRNHVNYLLNKVENEINLARSKPERNEMYIAFLEQEKIDIRSIINTMSDLEYREKRYNEYDELL